MTVWTVAVTVLGAGVLSERPISIYAFLVCFPESPLPHEKSHQVYAQEGG